MDFKTTTPEKLGIPSECLENFLKRLEEQQLPMHSAIIMRRGEICMEAYYAPYDKNTLHRMFSITKSFVSAAIGLLAEEGKLSLDDKITDYFPEKEPAAGFFPYTKMLTIREMLAMTTCHDKTTYKNAGTDDWVSTFFTTPPTHVPGTNFAYDTSSTHVLGALVEKLSGMKLLDYLRSKGLDELGFSKDAYVLCDPCGVSMGGSGLCATPRDILIMIMLIANDGALNGKQYLPRDYVISAKSKHSDPYGKQSALEEMQGYGYQIWMTRNGGYVLFGMGGQLALYVPEKDIYMITTADAQGRQGGVQLIYDAFWDEIYSKIKSDELPENNDAYKSLESFCSSRTLMHIPGGTFSPFAERADKKKYVCDSNPCGVQSVRLDFDGADSGTFSYKNDTGSHTLAFGIGKNEYGIFPDYNLKYAASAAWRMENYLLIKVQIIDSNVGNLYIGLSFKDDFVTVMLRKTVENSLNEYNGVFSGKRI